MRVAMVGALSLPIAPATTVTLPDGRVINGDDLPRLLPRTGGAVIQAWIFGTLSNATQPDSREECDLEHVCVLAISSAGGAGTGKGATIKNAPGTSSQVDPAPNLPFGMTEIIDYAHPVNRGVPGNKGQGACYPASGLMAIEMDASSLLVLAIVGQACQVVPSNAGLVFTGSYVAHAASTGTMANADGIGSLNINQPSGLPVAGTNPTAADTTWTKASLVGQLLYGK
jgi:hypothetical protein